MPLNPNTYASVADVERMVGEQAQGGRFRNAEIEDGVPISATDPSLSQVQDYINRATDYINARLRIAGYVTPISQTDYADSHSWAAEVCGALVSARIINSQPTREADAGLDAEASGNNRLESFHGQVAEFFRMVDAGLLIAEKLSSSSGRGSVGFPEPRDPTFTIDQTVER